MYQTPLMRVCIVGGGPAGLYTAKELLNNNVKVTLFEKSNKLGGLYNLSLVPNATTAFNNFVKNKNLNVKFNTEITRNGLKQLSKSFDAFVIAIGPSGPRKLQIPGNENCISSLDVIKRYKDISLGRKTCIIGMGNVSLDIIQYLFKLRGKMDCEEIVVLSNKDIAKSGFSNSEMKNVYNLNDVRIESFGDDAYNRPALCSDSKNSAFSKFEENKPVYGLSNDLVPLEFKEQKDKMLTTQVPKSLADEKADIKSNSSNPSRSYTTKEYVVNSTNWWYRRANIFKKLTEGRKSLKLMFNSTPLSIEKKENKLELTYKLNDKVKVDTFDSIISSIGFEDNRTLDVALPKPVFNVGWCRFPKGNICNALEDGITVANKILRYIRSSS